VTIPPSVGRTARRYPPYRYEVAHEKVREYSLATGWPDPASGVVPGELLAPPTFAAVFTLPQAASALAADPELRARPALHGSQEYEYHRAIRVGDVLECTPWIVDIRPRGSLSFLTLQIDCVDALSGEPVVTSRGIFMLPTQDPPDAVA
jgi:hypothetical protein